MNFLEPDPLDIDQQLARDLSQFYDDPLGFVYYTWSWGSGDLVGQDGPDKWQVEELNAIGDAVKHRNFNGVDAVDPIQHAIASGHGVGKSAFTAWVILWIMSTRAHAKGVVTANTAIQLKTKTWAELGKWLNMSVLKRWFEYTATTMYHRSHEETWRVDALTSREENSESFAGLHNASSTPFYIYDEASAIPDKIWEVSKGGLTDGEPMWFAFGNPTRTTGGFARCFKSESHRWTTSQIDSRTAKMPNKAYLDQMIDDYGIDSDFVRVRVLGKFPKASELQFIPSDAVYRAQYESFPRYLGDDALICGIDVSRGGGDDTYIQFRRGRDAKSEKVYKLSAETTRDSMRVVSIFSQIFKDHQPDVTAIDATGLGGPIYDRLIQLGFYVIPVIFGAKADNQRDYVNKSAEIWARMRQFIMDGGAIHSSERLEDELTSREYMHNSKGQLVLESKDSMKKRGVASPDWADALALTFASSVASMVRGTKDDIAGQRDKKHWDYDPLDNG